MRKRKEEKILSQVNKSLLICAVDAGRLAEGVYTYPQFTTETSIRKLTDILIEIEIQVKKLDSLKIVKWNSIGLCATDIKFLINDMIRQTIFTGEEKAIKQKEKEDSKEIELLETSGV